MDSVIRVLLAEKLHILFKKLYELLLCSLRVQHLPNCSVFEDYFYWWPLNSLFRQKSSIYQRLNQVSVRQFIVHDNLSQFQWLHVYFSVFDLHNNVKYMNGQLPFFLGISQPLDYFVAVDVFVLNDLLKFAYRVTDPLNELCYLCRVLELVFYDVRDEHFELIFA